MNVNLLLRVADQIEKRPELFDMNHWCGTTACIGGWAMIIHLGVRNEKARIALESSMTGVEAKNILGLTRDQAQELFYKWSASHSRYRDLTPDALRWMAATGKIDWKEARKFARCVKENLRT